MDLTKKYIFAIPNKSGNLAEFAISIENLKDYYEIGVHTTDISTIIKENSLLDKEAVKRMRSVNL